MFRSQLIIDYHGTFATPEGLSVLEDLSKRCFENRTTYVDQNPHGTAFQEGKRYMILYIRDKLRKDPHGKQQKEAN